tara:strand:- start:7025 stop:8587 length:1563 start_codon:yes stop_codon:yes gene_type:complete
MTWQPINCKTHYSLQVGFCKPDKLAKASAAKGFTSCGIADFGTLSGAVDFHQSCRKEGIKPVIGCEFDSYILYAKNKDGWFDLVQYVSSHNLEKLQELASRGNVLCVTKEKNGFAKLFKGNHLQIDYGEGAIYYVDKEDADCHRIMLCGKLKTTLKKIKDAEHDYKRFFNGDDKWYLEQDRKGNMSAIADRCEEYELAGPPMLPEFNCPDNYSEDDWLTELCRKGWKNKLVPQNKVATKGQQDIYAERIKHELKVIFKARLSGYFLIVQDIIQWVTDKGWLAGPGRGSAAGCLISYLLSITEVDPIEYDLIFERFYNEGRNTEGNVAIPDIDMDVPSEHRDEVIDYIKEKYGAKNVAQMITFGRLQGRSAIKEVLRVHNAVSFDEMNMITDSMPDEAAISDQLELMEDKSIIKWSLENQPEKLRAWCYYDDKGGLDGPLAKLFEQAINIEGTKKSQGKHPAGVIISKHWLEECCPMTKDKSGDPVVAFEMNPLEIQGHIKFDVLGIDLLSKIMEISDDNS